MPLQIIHSPPNPTPKVFLSWTKGLTQVRTSAHDKCALQQPALNVHLKPLIVLYCIVLHCIVLYCIVLYCIALHCIALHCIALYCIALHCIVLYGIVCYCMVLYCIANTSYDGTVAKSLVNELAGTWYTFWFQLQLKSVFKGPVGRTEANNTLFSHTNIWQKLATYSHRQIDEICVQDSMLEP